MDIDTNNASGKKVGPIIGVLIIVIILVIAALYTWGSHLNKANINAPVDSQTSEGQVSGDSATNASANADTNTNAKPAVMSQSDDVDSLSADLDSANTASSSGF